MQITANGKRLPILSRQTLLVMKLLMIFTLATCLYANANMSAQTVTLTTKQSTLEKVMREVRKQTGYAVVFNNSIKAVAKPVTIEAQDMALEAFLQQCFRDQPLTYEILNNKTIVIKEKKEVPKVTEGLNPRLEAAPPPPGIDVTIVVTDADGKPLEGASVRVKGNNKGVATDINGRALIRNVDPNATLIISYTGYILQEVTLSNRGINPSAVVVKLVASTNELDEVIINKGYYTEKQKFSTGSISTITSKDIEKQPVSNVLQALQGRVPGMMISQTSGLPGAGYQIQIRGRNSIDNGNQPLYIIDGVPYKLPSLLLSLGPINVGNPLNYINPSDIQSIDILKDADATAIYGSRGANGVILITTKKGRSEDLQVDASLSSGIMQAPKRLDLLNTQQYLGIRREAFQNDNATPTASNAPDLKLWDTTRYTDWQKELIGRSGHYTDAQISISGGNKTTQYLISSSYKKETPLFKGDYSDQRAGVHLSLNTASPNQKFKANILTSYFVDDNNLSSSDITGYITLPPNTPEIYESTGKLNWANGSWENPYANLFKKYEAKVNNLIANGDISYAITPNLQVKTSLGYTKMEINEYSNTPIASLNPFGTITTGSAVFYKKNIASWIIEPQIHYNREIGRGKLNVLCGLTVQKNETLIQSINANGYTSDALIGSVRGASSSTVSDNNSEYRYSAIFGRLNYTYNEEFLINLTGRRDGSSRFGPEKQFAGFGAIGGGWIFSKLLTKSKSFNFISFGKIRTSYGTTGNDQIGDYQYLDLYTTTFLPYQSLIGLYPNRLFNPALSWEVNKKLEIGIEIGLLRDRIFMTASYFRNHSSNQLLSYALPTVTGFSLITKNLPALVQNTGMEISLSTKNILTKTFSWATNFNLTVNRNKLVSFPDFQTSSYQSFYEIGQPLDIKKVYIFGGVNSTNGIYQFLDSKGNTINSPTLADRKAVDVTPRFFGGFENGLTYKKFKFDVFIQFVKQKGYNSLFVSSYPPGSLAAGNQLLSILNNWKQPGDNNSIQQFTQTTGPAYSGYVYAQQSDLAFVDASYIRLKNLSLSYQISGLSKSGLKLKDAKIFIQGENLLTITKYPALDPETQNFSMPPLKVFVVGIKLSL